MQVRHQLRQLAVRRDEAVVHVAGMAGGVADAGNPGELGHSLQQPPQRPGAAVGSRAMIGVDVLPDQRHFAHAGASEVPHLGDDLFDRARDLRAARVRHDAERAEFVAPFLHGDESRYAAAADRLAAGRRDGVELALGRSSAGRRW